MINNCSVEGIVPPAKIEEPIASTTSSIAMPEILTAQDLAALFHIYAHSATKSMLFLTTPRLAEVSGGSLKFRELQGSGLRDRDAGLFFMIGAFSMIGIPVFAGFSSKILFGLAAVDSGSSIKLIAVMLALAVSSLLNAIYFIRTVIRIYSAPEEGKKTKVRAHHRPGYNIPMLVLTAINLFLGLFSWMAAELVQRGLMMFG